MNQDQHHVGPKLPNQGLGQDHCLLWQQRPIPIDPNPADRSPNQKPWTGCPGWGVLAESGPLDLGPIPRRFTGEHLQADPFSAQHADAVANRQPP